MDVNRFRAGATIHAGNFTDLVYLSAYNRWCIPSGDVSAAESAGRLLGFQVLTGSGTYTPTAGATSALVIAIGGGGGSGGAKGNTPTDVAVTGGGSAGGMAQLYISPLAANYAYACGTGGTAGAATPTPTNGGNGGTTTFGSVLTVPGGGGSVANNLAGVGFSPAGAQSTLPTGGTINVSGQVGQPGIDIDIVSNISPILSDNCGGCGGSTNYGAGGAQQYASAAGKAGNGYGSGGGGAYAFDSTARAGAVGQAGVILVWEYS
jgi:hypothetical protein